MNNPATVAWLRRAISLLLLVCLALPLARCSVVKEPVADVAVSDVQPGAQNPPREPTQVVQYRENKPVYAGRMILDQFEEVADAKFSDLLHLVMLVVIFFLPLLTLVFRPLTQARIHALAALPALGYLVLIIYGLMGEALSGGWLAMASWLALFILGVHAIVADFRSRPQGDHLISRTSP